MTLLISFLSLWIKNVSTLLMSSDGLRRSLGFGALEMSAQNRSQILLRFTVDQVQTKVLGTLKLQLCRRRCDMIPFLVERTSYNFWYYQTSRTCHDTEMFLQIWFTANAEPHSNTSKWNKCGTLHIREEFIPTAESRLPERLYSAGIYHRKQLKQGGELIRELNSFSHVWKETERMESNLQKYITAKCIHVFTCSLACIHTLLIAETPAKDSPFLKWHEGQVLFATLSLSLHSHSCSLPAISLDCLLPPLPQKHLCRFFVLHLVSIVPHPWSDPSYFAEPFLRTTPTTGLKEMGSCELRIVWKILIVEWGPRWLLFGSEAEIFCKNTRIYSLHWALSPNAVTTKESNKCPQPCLHRHRLLSVSPGLMACLREKEYLVDMSFFSL